MLFQRTLQVLTKIEKRNASTIAFIGLGNMGSRMAGNLLKKGEHLKVYDVLPSAGKTLQGSVEVCPSAADAVKDASMIITMLPTGTIVKETLFGPKGILKTVTKGAILVDSSTIAPKTAKELSDIAQKNQLKYVDAPVSGGVPGAQNATLTFMVGGKKADCDLVEPTLLHMGRKVLHCGDIGSGQVAKLCNNLILGVTMIGTAEAMNLGIKSGLDAKLLASIVNISTGRSWSSDTYHPVPGVMENVPAADNYKGGFAVNLIAKDLGLAEETAVDCNVPVPMGANAHQIFRTLMSHGLGDKDFSVVYQFLKGMKQC